MDTPESLAGEKSFAVRCERTANWLVRKVAEHRRYVEKVKRWAVEEAHRAEHEEARLMTLYGGQLQEWARDELARRGGKGKTVYLPAGKVGFRRLRPKLVVVDEGALIEWADANLPNAVVVSRRVLVSRLLEAFEEDGEVPDGSEVIGPRESFFVG